MKSESSLRGSYWPTVAITLLALSPNFILSTALGLVGPTIAQSLGAGPAAISLVIALSNAALALGAVIAADLAQHFGSFRLFLIYSGIFVLGSFMGALAPNAPVLILGHLLQGLATGLLLVATLPPLVTGFPATRLKTTIPVAVIGLFGAVTAGPLVGGLIAQTGAWRLMFGATGALGLLALVLALFALAARPPMNPEARFDVTALVLAASGVGFAFYGVSRLGSGGPTSPQVYVPVALGVVLLASLLVLEALRREPLMPVKLLTTTFPVMGILAAIISGAAFTGTLQLMTLFLQRVRGLDPLATGLLFWPDLVAGLLGALIVGAVLTTRWILALPFFGMLALTAAVLLLVGITQDTTDGRILLVSGLLGLGASLTVTPGLLMAALSVTPSLVGRAIALVQLLRLSSAYLVAPALMYAAEAAGPRPEQLLTGLHTAFWVVLGVLVAGIVVITAIYLASGATLHPPGLQAFLNRDEPAFDSPPIREHRETE